MAGLSKVKGSGLATGAATASLVGIDDNATSTAITISAAEAVTFASDVTVGGELNLTAASNNFIDYTDALHIRAAGSSPAYEDSIYCAKDSQVGIKHNGSTKLATTSTGVDVTGDVTVNTGNLVIGTSGKGIDFSAATPDGTGSTGSEVLDDYEEGTWTPELVNGTSITYSSQSGKYVKIGSVVHVECYINVSNSSTGDGSNVAVSGLPYSVDILSGSACPTFGINIYDNTFLDIATHGAAHLNFLSTALVLDFTYSQCNTSGKLRMSATYRV